MSCTRALVVAVAAAAIGGTSARPVQEVVDGFVARSFKSSSGATMPYTVFIPNARASKTPLPLILYLHGSGGIGSDNLRQISDGNATGTHVWTTAEAQRKHPAFVLAPPL